MFSIYVASMIRCTISLHNLINNREDMKLNDKEEAKKLELEKKESENKEIEVKN